MTDVNIYLTHNGENDANTPAKGSLRWTPSARRDVEGDPDEVVLPKSFNVPLHLGVGLAQPDPNDPDVWYWIVDELVTDGITRTVNVPDSGPVDYADLDDVVPVPAGDVAAARQSSLDAEIARATDAEADLQGQIDDIQPGTDTRKPAKYVDTLNAFFGATSGTFQGGQSITPTTTTASTSANATVIPVASATGLIAGVSVVLLAGTVNQKVVTVVSVAGSNLTVTPAMPTAMPSGTAVAPVWADTVHLTDAGYTGLAFTIMAAKNADGTDYFHVAAGERVTYIGNSWFQYARDNPPDEFAQAVTNKFPGALVTNVGVSGNRGADVVARFDTDVPHDSKYVIFNEPGGNSLGSESMHQIVAELAIIVRKCQAIGAIAVYTGAAPGNALLTNSVAMITELLRDGYSMAAADAIVAFTDQALTVWYP